MCVHYFAPRAEMLQERDKGKISSKKPYPYRDIFPGIRAPIYLAAKEGLELVELLWGYPVSWQKGPVFNTRLESAIKGKKMWKDSFENRRCLIPCLGFYEPHKSQRVPSPHTGKPIKQLYLFDKGGDIFYLAGIYQDKYFSLLTTAPNSHVRSIHDRMPLVVKDQELFLWLGGESEQFLDREEIKLNIRARYPQPLQF